MTTDTVTHARPQKGQKIASATRGVHHLALTTDDMKATADFFVHVVGMPLVHAMKVPAGLGTGPENRGNPPYECLRHYFFDMGNDSLLAFFEIPKGAEPAARRDAIGGMQHCAFAVSADQFAALMARLKQHRVAFDGPFESLPGLQSIYFFDPNGLRLEACYEPGEGKTQRVIDSVLQTRAVAAGELHSVGAGAQWVASMSAALPEDS